MRLSNTSVDRSSVSCTRGVAFLAGLLLTPTALSAATLEVNNITMVQGTSGYVVVSGGIAGEATMGLTIRLQIVPQAATTGTVAFTPAPTVDIVQLQDGDPWPGVGTFSAYDTDLTQSPTLNGSIDDKNDTFAATPLTFPTQGGEVDLVSFPVIASADALGVWDVFLSTSRGDSSWQSVPTTLTHGTITVYGPPDSPIADPEVPDDGHGTRNRYLSVTIPPSMLGFSTGLRVTLTSTTVHSPDLDLFVPLAGEHWWVGEPHEVTEASCCNGSTPAPTFRAARLGCEPHWTDWAGYTTQNGSIHIYGAAGIPDSLYEIRVIYEGCDLAEEGNYSEALVMRTSTLGDITRDCGVQPCSPPNGVVEFVDISAVVDKFRNLPSASGKARSDLMNSNVGNAVPDRQVDFVDIATVTNVFQNPELDNYLCPPPTTCPFPPP